MAATKQNITVALDKRLLRKARVHAARRGTSISAMLAAELERVVMQEDAYELARVKALALLDSPFRLGGEKPLRREDLHDRQGLR